MDQIRKRIQTILECFRPSNMKCGLLAAFLSVLSVFTFLIAICPEWYNSLPIYSELITGVTTFSGYNKVVDMQIVKVVLFGIPIFFFVFCGVQYFLEKKLRMPQNVLGVTLAGYILWLVSIINDQNGSMFYGIAIFLWLVCYSVLKQKDNAVFGLLVYVAVQSIASVVIWCVNGNGEEQSWIYVVSGVFTCLWIVGSVIGFRGKKYFVERQIDFWQIFIPVCLIPMSTFSYYYETTGETFLLFYSARYKYFMYGLAILFVAYSVYRYIKQKKEISVTTLISIAMLRSFTMPEGILNIDFFHMGEMSTPFMQLQEYGKLPFFDLMPIHGLCDYYYSVINFLFLDNTYLSMNGAMTIGNLLLAAALAVLIYVLCEKKTGALLLVYCFVPFIVNNAGIRYIFLCVSFFVLFSAKVRKCALTYVWWYVILSIVSITWNMSIGGAGAAAFFPIVLFWYIPKAIQELKDVFGSKEKVKILSIFISYGFLFILGVCYIPVFLQIVGYLRENTGTTLMANGMAMIEEMGMYEDYLIPTLYEGEKISFLGVFGFVIPFIACLVLGFGKFGEQVRRDGKEFAVVYFVCLYIIANYAFVRFDNGLRTSVLSVLFLVIFLLGTQKWKKTEFWLLALLTVFMTKSSMGIYIDDLANEKVVESSIPTLIWGEEVEDPIVYITGDSVDMNRLGNGFIRGNTLQNLQNLKKVYDSEVGKTKEYLDLTNGVANYVFLNGAMVLPYTSGYNISNETMQKLAIEQLKEHPVDLIVLAPYIRFDEATISLRSPLLYEYLYEAGYKPYVYENVIYMKKSESVLFPESNGIEAFSELCHKQALQMLPVVWGNSEAVHSLNKVNIDTQMSVDENGVTWSLLEEVGGMNLDFVKITIPEQYMNQDGTKEKQEKDKDAMSEIRFIFGEEKYEFTFYCEGNNFLIPVYSSPFWKSLDSVERFSIQTKEGESLPIEMFENAIVSFWNY